MIRVKIKSVVFLAMSISSGNKEIDSFHSTEDALGEMEIYGPPRGVMPRSGRK